MKKILISKFIKEIIKFLRTYKKIIQVFIVGAIFTDIFFNNNNSDLVIFGLLFVYIFFNLILELKSKAVFLLCILLLVAMFISYLITGTSTMTEKAAVWLVLLLFFGVIKQWKE